jgi:hypothetical protein
MLDLSAVPRLGAGVLFERTPEESYLYDLESHSYALLDNEVAVEIISLCDGTRTIGSICDRLAFLFDASPERIQRDVLAMLTTLVREEFIRASTENAQKS